MLSCDSSGTSLYCISHNKGLAQKWKLQQSHLPRQIWPPPLCHLWLSWQLIFLNVLRKTSILRHLGPLIAITEWFTGNQAHTISYVLIKICFSMHSFIWVIFLFLSPCSSSVSHSAAWGHSGLIIGLLSIYANWRSSRSSSRNTTSSTLLSIGGKLVFVITFIVDVWFTQFGCWKRACWFCRTTSLNPEGAWCCS